jgi:hypothetical protein
MSVVFIEMPAFARRRDDYFDDERLRRLQSLLMANPLAGDVIVGCGGLRKLRIGDPRRGKGARGGLRVIYYFWSSHRQFWLYGVYDKDEAEDLNDRQRRTLREALITELSMRSGT